MISRMKSLSIKSPAIFLMGPTAAGKTDLAISLAERFPVEIISVDSAMIYRGMDIGTGKPTASELKIAPHHLIDIRYPHEPYSAALFRKDALQYMAEITSRGNIPLLVGGTMLYFKALQQGLSPLPSANPEIRAKLLSDAEKLGWQALHDRLKIIDPLSSERIHPNDPQRLQRALEVFEITGIPMSAFFHPDSSFSSNDARESLEQKSDFPYEVHSFAIMPKNPEERLIQRERITARFHKMLEMGFMAEVQNLKNQYSEGNKLNFELPAFRSVGYRQALEHLAHDYDHPEMIRRAITATCQLAKRQVTWLRSLSNIVFLSYPTSNNGLNQKNNLSASLDSMIDCISRMGRL